MSIESTRGFRGIHVNTVSRFRERPFGYSVCVALVRLQWLETVCARVPPTRPRSTGMERKETVSAMNTNRSERIRRALLRASYRPFIVLRDMRLTSNLLFLVGFDLHGGRFDGERREVFLFLFSKSRNETSSSLLLLDFEIL